MHLDLTTLRVFLTVADERNIARAAEREHLAASAISKRIADLERDLDAPLLERHRAGVELTPAGLALTAHARSIFDIAERMQSELSTFAAGVKGHVRLAANPSSITQFLPPILARFVSSHPEIRIRLLEETSARTVRLVEDRAVDLGIVAGSVDFRGLASFDFRRDTLAMMVHRNHPLARRRRVPFAATLAFDQVGLAEGSSIQATLIDAAHKLGHRLDLKVRVASFDALRRLVEANIGIACLPVGCIEPYGRVHNLVTVGLTDAWANRQLKVCLRDRASAPLAVRRFIDALDVGARDRARMPTGSSAKA